VSRSCWPCPSPGPRRGGEARLSRRRCPLKLCTSTSYSVSLCPFKPYCPNLTRSNSPFLAAHSLSRRIRSYCITLKVLKYNWAVACGRLPILRIKDQLCYITVSNPQLNNFFSFVFPFNRQTLHNLCSSLIAHFSQSSLSLLLLSQHLINSYRRYDANDCHLAPHHLITFPRLCRSSWCSAVGHSSKQCCPETTNSTTGARFATTLERF
jgi:hypothetical protein